MQQSYGGTPMAPPPAPAQFPPPAPAQVPPVEPPRKAGSGKALSGIAMALGAAAIAIALIGMVMFPGPAGAAGIKGDTGDAGDTGAPGTNGANGANGANDANVGNRFLSFIINSLQQFIHIFEPQIRVVSIICR